MTDNEINPHQSFDDQLTKDDISVKGTPFKEEAVWSLDDKEEDTVMIEAEYDMTGMTEPQKWTLVALSSKMEDLFLEVCEEAEEYSQY